MRQRAADVFCSKQNARVFVGRSFFRSGAGAYRNKEINTHPHKHTQRETARIERWRVRRYVSMMFPAHTFRIRFFLSVLYCWIDRRFIFIPNDNVDLIKQFFMCSAPSSLSLVRRVISMADDGIAEQLLFFARFAHSFDVTYSFVSGAPHHHHGSRYTRHIEIAERPPKPEACKNT